MYLGTYIHNENHTNTCKHYLPIWFKHILFLQNLNTTYTSSNTIWLGWKPRVYCNPLKFAVYESLFDKKIGYYTKVSINMVAYVLQYNILIFLILTVAFFYMKQLLLPI